MPSIRKFFRYAFSPALLFLAVLRKARKARQRQIPCVNVPDLNSVHETVVFDTSNGGSISLGTCVEVREGTVICSSGGNISIGSNAFIGPYCVLYGHGGLQIGADTLIAAHVVIIPANHRFEDRSATIASQGQTQLGIKIGNDCWIGAGAKILDGVTLGDGCIVGAGAVVCNSVPDMAIVAGVPARVLRHRDHAMKS